jgi:hypothetical protein
MWQAFMKCESFPGNIKNRNLLLHHSDFNLCGEGSKDRHVILTWKFPDFLHCWGWVTRNCSAEKKLFIAEKM